MHWITRIGPLAHVLHFLHRDLTLRGSNTYKKLNHSQSWFSWRISNALIKLTSYPCNDCGVSLKHWAMSEIHYEFTWLFLVQRLKTSHCCMFLINSLSVCPYTIMSVFSSCTQFAACLSSERHLISNSKFSYVNLMQLASPANCVSPLYFNRWTISLTLHVFHLKVVQTAAC